MDDSERSSLEPLLFATNERSNTDIVDKVNAKNAKKLAVAMIVIFVVYHTYIHLRYGKDSCRWLLSDGRYKGDMGWQPYGCMMHIYSEVDGIRCMKSIAFRGGKNSFAFIGDYRMKDMYQAFINNFTPKDDTSSSAKKIKTVLDPFAKQSNLSYSDERMNLKVDYVWSPYISKLMNELFNQWNTSKQVPGVILIGCATWSIKATNGSKEAVEEYIQNITHLLDPFENLCKKSKILWVLQAPVNEEKLNVSNAMITNAVIDEYNKAAMMTLRYSCVELWSSSRLIAQGQIDDMEAGIELSPSSLNTDVQLLLNMYCNDYMNHNDGTCCATTEPVTYIQLAAFILLLICLLIGCCLVVKPLYCYNSRFSDFKIIMVSMAKLALIMAYFYLCDRTNFFMKENKYYSAVSFWLPLAYVFTLGLFFTEEGRYTKILNRDQTDEWKGWMQLVILIYQLTGASFQLPIYNHVLILASAYLFLTGYGHFSYLWYRSEAGLIRILQVLFRLNFMTVVLCFCMNRPYQFYYFIPVVTFWVLFLYFFLLFPPRVTAANSENWPIKYAYVVFKILIMFVGISILYTSQVFFERIFLTRPWKALFVTTDDDIQHWWFNWKLDRFSALYGASFALFLIVVQRHNFLDDNNHNNLFSARVSVFSAILALLGLMVTSTYATICPNRLEFIDIQTYISVAPIICYIILRNVSGILRARYSTVFAFFGKISLELFVGHFHIWLSSDSNGVLVLIPRYPVLNVLVVSYIFVCISYELHAITKTLMPYAVPSDWKLVLRNLVIFLLLLVPAGIRDDGERGISHECPIGHGLNLIRNEKWQKYKKASDLFNVP